MAVDAAAGVNGTSEATAEPPSLFAPLRVGASGMSEAAPAAPRKVLRAEANGMSAVLSA